MQLDELTEYNQQLRDEASSLKKKSERDVQKEKKCPTRSSWTSTQLLHSL